MAIEGIKSHYKESPCMYHVLTEEQCEIVINNGLEILEDVGYMVDLDEIRDFMVEKGCTVDDKGAIHVPRDLVKWALETAPSTIQMYDRFGNPTFNIGDDGVYFGCGYGNPYINDFDTGERRALVVTDVAKNSLVADACPNIDFVMPLGDPTDVPAPISDTYGMREMLRNTTKTIMCNSVYASSLDYQFQQVIAVAGGWDAYHEKPFVMAVGGDPVTPLFMDRFALRKLKYCAEHSIPFVAPSGSELGATTPITLAAAFSLIMAENFFAITLSELLNPGCPVMGGFGIIGFDMKTSVACYGAPEHLLAESASGDIYRYLGIPLWGTAGAGESKLVDQQLTMEYAISIFASALNGGHVVHDMGFMDCALTTHHDAIVLADEIIGYSQQIRKGIDFSDDCADISIIKEVGPRGQFITTMHTAQHFREVWIPSVFDRDNYTNWEVDKKDMGQRIHERTARILETHEVPPLPDDVNVKLDQIIEAAEADLPRISAEG